MAKHFTWFKFEWDAWREDRDLRRCSKQTKGFWIDCIALMEKEEVYFLEGTPEELCRDIVATREEFDNSVRELHRTNAATISKSQGRVKIVSRRILKRVNLTEYNRLKQAERRCQLKVKVKSKGTSKDIEILESFSYEKDKKEGKESAAGTGGKPPLREIFFGTLEAGLTERMGITTLPNQREWHQRVFEWAFLNDRTTDAVLETYDLMKKGFWKNKSVSPKSLADNIPNLETLRAEVKGGEPSAKVNGQPTQREAIATEQARIERERTQELGGVQ